MVYGRTDRDGLATIVVEAMRFTFSTSHELPLQRANVAIVIAKVFKKLKCYESCDFIPYLSTDRRETGVSRTIAFPNWSLGTSRVAFTLNSYHFIDRSTLKKGMNLFGGKEIWR